MIKLRYFFSNVRLLNENIKSNTTMNINSAYSRNNSLKIFSIILCILFSIIVICYFIYLLIKLKNIVNSKLNLFYSEWD